MKQPWEQKLLTKDDNEERGRVWKLYREQEVMTSFRFFGLPVNLFVCLFWFLMKESKRREEKKQWLNLANWVSVTIGQTPPGVMHRLPLIEITDRHAAEASSLQMNLCCLTTKFNSLTIWPLSPQGPLCLPRQPEKICLSEIPIYSAHGPPLLSQISDANPKQSAGSPAFPVVHTYDYRQNTHSHKAEIDQSFVSFKFKRKGKSCMWPVVHSLLWSHCFSSWVPPLFHSCADLWSKMLPD